LLKTLKTERKVKKGATGVSPRACKAGALPAELHATFNDIILEAFAAVREMPILAACLMSNGSLCGAQSFRKTMNRILPKFSENAYTSQPFMFSEIYSGY
jgi:hypothetical protein